MFEAVKEILSKQLRIPAEKIELNSRVKADLGADSLNVLQLLMEVEDRYGITIPDEELATFETVRDVVEYLERTKA